MRDNSVAISKAIAIMLMVLAHTYFLDFGNKWINMFHMPLFFFFAGYCMKEKYLSHFMDFVLKRIKGLYVPFVKWGLVFLLLHNVFYHLDIYNDEYGFRGKTSYIYDWQEMAVRCLHIVTSMSGNEQLLGGYWFLKSLLFGSVAGCLSIRYFDCRMGGVILLASTVLLSAFDIHVPYLGIGARETFAACFFWVGYMYKNAGYCIHRSVWIVPLGIAFVSIGTVLWQSSLLNFSYWQVIPYTISALAGILMIFCLADKINMVDGKFKSSIIYIGNNTLTILTWHFLCFKLVSLLIIIVYNLPVKRLAEFPVIAEYTTRGWFAAYFLTGVLLPLLFAHTKYLK